MTFPWQHYWAHLRNYGIAILIFLLGLFLSFATFRSYQQQDLNRTRAEFDRLADLRLFLIKDNLLAISEQMNAIQQFYDASDDVTEKDFHHFVHNFFNFSQSLIAFGWIEANGRDLSSTVGLEFIDITQPITSVKTSKFFPFTYLEKANIEQPLYIDSPGYEIFSAFLQKSSQNPLIMTVSDEVTLIQNEKQPGFFLFKPVFSRAKDSSEMNLLGTIVVFSNFKGIIENVRAQVEAVGMNIGIYQIAESRPTLIYWNAATILQDPSDLSFKERQLQEQWARYHRFPFGDHIWELKATPSLGFIYQRMQLWSHWGIPAIGILISGLMASYFLVLVNRRILIEEEVKTRTDELATTNRQLQQEIHERQRIEEDLMKKQKYLQRRHESLEYLTKLATSEFRTAVHEVILRTAIVMQIERVGVWLYHPTKPPTLYCEGIYNLSSRSFSNHLQINSREFPHYFETLPKQSHLILPSPHNPELNREFSSYLAVFHILSKLDIPIVFEGNLLGVLSCEETKGHHHWSLEDRHFGQTIADIIALMIEQSAKRKAEKALQESEGRLHFIAQNAADGIISINDKKEMISWNLGAEKIFGYREEEILGKSLHTIIPQDGAYMEEEISQKPFELKGQHKDGHLFPAEISLSRWKSGDLYFNTLIIRDITERKEHEKRVIKAMREAKAANEAKNEFLATISHELRTPLNAIIGFDQCLLMGMDGPINDAQHMSLKKIEKSSFHLLNIISDLLDFSKIEAKKMELEVMPHNIVDIVTSCVEEMQSLAQLKNLTLTVNIPQPFILIEVDRVRIRQVILNLLSNAIKFTEKGSIKVTILNQPEHICIQVTDTGIGLAAQEIEKIFQPFSQADSSITRKYGGTGLGLVISKRIIEQHLGTISIESEKGKGSTFTVTIPKGGIGS